MKSIEYGLLPLMVLLAVSCGKEPKPKQEVADEKFNEYLMLYFDTDKNGELSEAEILAVEEMDCSYWGIRSLDGISRFSNLRFLNCYCNLLQELDVSMLKKLDTLECGDNELEALDVSGCTALTYLSCDMNQLTNLDVSGCTALTRLFCFDNQLTSLDAGGLVALTELDCNDNQLTSIDLSGCTTLETLNCDYNQLTSIDLSSCTALRNLYYNGNEYHVMTTNNRFDLSLLPGDFEVAKASDWSGGTVKGNILTFKGNETYEGQVCASYTYQTGYTGEDERCKTVRFTLVCDNFN